MAAPLPPELDELCLVPDFCCLRGEAVGDLLLTASTIAFRRCRCWRCWSASSERKSSITSDTVTDCRSSSSSKVAFRSEISSCTGLSCCELGVLDEADDVRSSVLILGAAGGGGGADSSFC